MCGLSCVLLYPQKRNLEEWQAIRECFTQTLVANEERGREAAGIALIEKDGSYLTYKAPLPVSALISRPEYQKILHSLGEKTVCIIGHTRMPTKGTPLNNLNNHPLHTGHVLGIHNGHISNDDHLFQKFQLIREAEVDSEIIFRIIDSIPIHDLNEEYLNRVQRNVSFLQGRFTTISIDLRKPTQLLVLKYDMPLCLHYHQPWEVLFFTSRYIFLRKAFGKAVVTEALPSKSIYLFDAEQIPCHGSEAIQKLPLILA